MGTRLFDRITRGTSSGTASIPGNSTPDNLTAQRLEELVKQFSEGITNGPLAQGAQLFAAMIRRQMANVPEDVLKDSLRTWARHLSEVADPTIEKDDHSDANIIKTG